MKESRKQFIKEAHSHACSEWKEKIEKEFPKLFESEFNVGDWIIITKTWHEETSRKGHVSRITRVLNIIEKQKYVFDGCTGNDFTASAEMLRKAKPEEIKEALIEEAKKRGFKEGITVECAYNADIEIIDKINFRYEESDVNHDEVLWVTPRICIYENGKWATIIKTKKMTQEEIEAELGYKIEIV